VTIVAWGLPMKRTAAISMVLATGLLSVGCGEQHRARTPREWLGTLEVVDGLTVARNPSEPLLGQLTLELVEDLVIGDTVREESLFFNRITARVDARGNLYVWDPNSFRIQVFNREGRFVRTVGRRGEGPGEFSDGFGLRFRVSSAGRLAVLDGGRIQLFDSLGVFLQAVPITTMSTRFATLGENWLLVDHIGRADDGPTEEVLVSEVGSGLSRTIASYPSVKWRSAFIDRFRFTHLAPELVIAPWSQTGGAYGFPSWYRVTLVDQNGQAVRVIEVVAPPLEVDSELERVLLEEMSSDVPGRSARELRGEVYIPDTWPFFDAMFSDESGSLLVQRSEPVHVPNAPRRLDLFTLGPRHGSDEVICTGARLTLSLASVA
jgi:hypothetical protein